MIALERVVCAWQLAGPHRSEYSATSSTRDPRSGRARLFGILPALALLLTALWLFAAAPAEAQVRSNLQATAGDGEVTVTWDEVGARYLAASSFSTGNTRAEPSP